ncbi:MAG: ParB N-terminal domain-containing protein [Eggerthellaceae bacterium]|nr:ParB N-terminal domain-containing protein [Eggerthellaceae bacterium]
MAESQEQVRIVAELEDGICLAQVPLSMLREQDLNARVMDDAKFAQLVANIGKRGTLEQLPYCVETDRGVEIVSGHHRTRAAREAGLEHVYTLLDRSKLSRSAIAAKQLAHNAIEGVDDEDTLRKIAAIVTDVDDMLETALGDEFFEKAYREAQAMPIPKVDFNWKNVTFTFLPHQLADLEEYVKSTPASDWVGACPVEQFDETVEAIQRVQKFEDIKNVGMAVHAMVAKALESYPDDDGEYVSIASVFGRGAIRKETADKLKALVKQHKEDGVIEDAWELFDLLADR